jgi:tetratricopeptide (TPR) repeat protein
MKRIVFLWGGVLLLFCPLVFGQVIESAPELSAAPGGISYLSLHINPAVEIPIGSSSPLYTMGGSVGLAARYRLPKMPLLFLSGGLDYSLNPLNMDSILNKISAGLGVGAQIPLTPSLGIVAYATGGYSFDYMDVDGSIESAWNPFVDAGAGIQFLLMKNRLGLGAGGAYKNYFGLYNAVGIYAGTSYHFPVKQRLKVRKAGSGQIDLLSTADILQLSDIEFENIFPVFHKYYDDHPIGKALLQNPYNKPVTEIEVTLFVRQYMDVPKKCTSPVELDAGAAQEIELNALFTDRVLDITEATKVAVEIGMEYTYEGSRYKDELVETIRVYDRNAMTWDDDRKAAAFVTAKDPMVLTFSKNVAGMVKDKGSRAVDNNLLIGMALHKALSLYGMTYIIDPRTPYAEFSKQKDAIDFLQFPRQSLEYKAGDCDDLSILYSSLLGALGVEAAFITVPGHILVALALEVSPDEARKSFLNPDELIFHGGKVWIPVEITELKAGFLEAWQTGAREWREYSANDQAGFFPLYDAWKLYEPVGLPPGGREITLPPEDRIVSEYLQEVVRFIDREIYPRVNKLQSEIARTGSVRAMNNLGVLYARYGLHDKAEEQFQDALRTQEFVPALINLGNIYYLKGDMNSASVYYDRAYRLEPNDPKVLLCVARVNHELGNYEVAQSTYSKLESRDPELAKQFAYLTLTGTESARAAEVGRLKERVVWEDE